MLSVGQVILEYHGLINTTALSTKKIILPPFVCLAGNSEILLYFTVLPTINTVLTLW